jgi:hypothetical protein
MLGTLKFALSPLRLLPSCPASLHQPLAATIAGANATGECSYIFCGT